MLFGPKHQCPQNKFSLAGNISESGVSSTDLRYLPASSNIASDASMALMDLPCLIKVWTPRMSQIYLLCCHREYYDHQRMRETRREVIVKASKASK